MIEWVKKILAHTPLYDPARKWWIALQEKNKIAEWEKAGRPAPPPHAIKRQMILQTAEQHGLKVFVETGTYYGDMIDAVKNSFDEVYSIELSQELFAKAKKRFRNDSHVQLLQGDSGTQLGGLLSKLNHPALFWLDSHYSWGVTARGEKDTPIFEELTHIFSGKKAGHVIVIDDARWFGTIPAYPPMKELEEFVREKKRDVKVVPEHDCIVITES
jgi:hypothetical protein